MRAGEITVIGALPLRLPTGTRRAFLFALADFAWAAGIPVLGGTREQPPLAV